MLNISLTKDDYRELRITKCNRGSNQNAKSDRIRTNIEDSSDQKQQNVQ